MAGLKTAENDGDVAAFLAAVPDPQKRQDSERLLEIMQRATGCPPRMWGSSIVGFGRYRYTNTTGKEAGWFLTGFSPRKQALTLYIMPGFSTYDGLLAKLGKHKTGKSCLYVKRLDDIDLGVVETLVKKSVALMRERYETT